ncbi:peptidoglycan DD-metalloendopeptidase family protein [Candidatus Kaiserbacteria bacterium]|nr:MAG: peptidoglycan DD-metalloendopeptidase family protein [Candidatus Kaiserbacteria bacterium]
MILSIRSLFVGFLIATLWVPVFSDAQNADDLRDKINEQQSEIAEIETEIKKYEQQLTEIGREKQTLESAVKELDVSRQKVSASVSLAQRQINATNSSISELSDDIDAKEILIGQNQDALAETLRRIHETESGSFVEVILGSDDISNLWNDLDSIQQFQIVVRNEVEILAEQKTQLEDVKTKKEIEQGILVEHKTELSTQKRSLDINRQAKNNLLKETQSRESTYQELIAIKRQAKEEFEAQLRSFEAELQYILDPTTIPPAGKGVLSWPLSNVTITQNFGNTKFASSGAYNGSGHNGVDFRAAIGTPVKATLSGNVKATGNTDAFRGCYSYGKWILIEHVNGLATLYAHLSDINVSPGEAVGTGKVIGYSGNTGFSTGPHLHFTVYASDAVQVVRLGDVKSRTNCADAKIPVASWSGYLNPLDYL